MSLMNDESQLIFEEVDDWLVDAKVDLCPAELHGIVCGFCSCGGSLESINKDLILLFIGEGEADEVPQERIEDLIRFVTKASEQLCEESFTFTPLLPADAQPMSERSSALGNWCKGFLYGFGASGRGEEQIKNPDCKEALEDFAEIVKISDVFEEDEATAEVAYSDVVEYVRAAAMLIHESKPMTH